MGWWNKLVRDKKEEERLEAERAKLEEEKLELLKKRDPKEYHTRKKEPWVNVLDVKVNEDNVRNGFLNLTGTNTLFNN